MKSHDVWSLYGVDWGQWAAMIAVLTALSAGVTGIVLTWLRLRLGRYFVVRPDHDKLIERLRMEHEENKLRMASVESSLADLATKHSVNNVQQNQVTMFTELGKMRETMASVGATITAMSESNKGVSHMMGLVLDHMMDRDKP